MSARHGHCGFSIRLVNPSVLFVCLIAPVTLALLVVFSNAQASPSPSVRKLMVAPHEHCSAPGKNFKLLAIQAVNTHGRAIELPADLIEMRNPEGWLHVDPLAVPPFKGVLPPKLRDKASLIYSSYFGWKNWMVVPRGWKLCSAALGQDGDGLLVLESPSGWSTGWLELDSTPACFYCKWGVTMGLIPWAYAALGKDAQEGLKESNPPPYKLEPTPWILIHPNLCTAVFVYKPKNSLPIHAVVLMNNNHDHRVHGLHIAVPSKQKFLARYLLNRYRKINPVCVSKPSPSKRENG